MKRTVMALLLASALLIICLPSGAAGSKLKLVKHNGGFFTINKPAGWKVTTAGRGCTLAFLVRDPSCSLRQIFSFNEVGPFYASDQQKMSEINYVNSGGYPMQWLDMPVIYPLTTSSFFKNFHLIANTRIAKGFMPGMPHLESFSIVSTKKMKSPAAGFSIEVVRAIFKQDGKLGEGLFTGMIGPVQPYGWGLYVTGITAKRGELSKMQGSLIKSLRSFYLSKSYVDQCLREQQENFKGLLRAGKTMEEASDIITKGWQERSKVDDIMAEKRSDQILGKDRYYDPDTGEVYEFDINSGDPARLGLKELPEHDYNLWMKPTHDGRSYVRH